MQKRRLKYISILAFCQMFLLVSMSFAIAFILSEEVGVVSAAVPVPSFENGYVGELPSALPVKTGFFDPPPAVQGSSSGGTGIQAGVKNVFAGNAFGGQFLGSLVQGVAWGATLALATKAILGMVGVDSKTSDAAAIAVFAGSVGGGLIKGLLIYGKGNAKAGLMGKLTAGQAGFLGGVLITAVVFIALYKKEKKQIIRFECLPWEPPLGGAKCEECNKNPFRPCSEYRCKSLGQACELLNAGTGNEQCVWVSKFDVESPKITPWVVALEPKDLKYISDTSVRPPALGVKIVKGSNDCIEAFTPLKFGVTTNEPSQCKIDYNHTTTFEKMSFYFGGDNYYSYNHTQTMRLPGPGKDVDLSPLLENDGTFSLFVRCRDANGNENVDEYSVKYCVNQGPDTTPPIVEKTSIISGSPVQYNVDKAPIEVYTNEPADCKWSSQSKAFEDMENTMQCASDISQLNSDLLYTCSGTLTSVKDRESNLYYFRCKDQPGEEEKNRNVMVQSYELSLKGSQPLVIDSVGPNSTISGSTSAVKATLSVLTSNGAEEGKAVCSFSLTGEQNTFVPMFKTNSYQHYQELSLTNGTYSYQFRCVDAGGNIAIASTNFKVDVDTATPRVTRVYKDQALKIVTDEDAECRYSLNSCNFNFDEGIRMAYSNSEVKNQHFADWKPGTSYYVKCTDVYGNQPDPSGCSIVVRPTELRKQVV